MSALVHQLKAEPLDLSDSDSDKLLIEESTCDTADDEKWVRRSSRKRRSSTRFFDYLTGEEDPTTSRAAPKNPKNRADGVKKPISGSSRKVEPGPSDEFVRSPWKEELKKPDPLEIVPIEPIDPGFLVSYVEKTKKMILPGQYAVKVPTGPGGQYVNIDGAEYLRGLGYYDNDSLIEEVVEEQIEETKPTLHIPERKTEPAPTEKELLRRRVEFEAQRAMMTQSVGKGGHRELEALISLNCDRRDSTPANQILRIKEVDEPDQFSSASAYSSDEERDDSDGNDEIDVTGGTPPRPPMPLHAPIQAGSEPKAPVIEILSDSSGAEGPSSSKSLKKPSSRSKDDLLRSSHNEMEKIRRRQMRDLFIYLNKCLLHHNPDIFPDKPSNTSKVRILMLSREVITELISKAQMLLQNKSLLTDQNRKLRARYSELEAILKGLKPTHHLKRSVSKQTTKGRLPAQQTTKAGLRAQQNAQAGASALQTADGALAQQTADGALAQQTDEPKALLQQPGKAGALLQQPGKAGALLQQPGKAGALLQQPGKAGALLQQPGKAGTLQTVTTSLAWQAAKAKALSRQPAKKPGEVRQGLTATHL